MVPGACGCARPELSVTIVGPTAGEVYASKLGYPVVAEAGIDDVTADDFDAVVVPGGFSPEYLRRAPAMVDLVRKLDARGDTVAAICHAGWLLATADIVRGRPVTSVAGHQGRRDSRRRRVAERAGSRRRQLDHRAAAQRPAPVSRLASSPRSRRSRSAGDRADPRVPEPAPRCTPRLPWCGTAPPVRARRTTARTQHCPAPDGVAGVTGVLVAGGATGIGRACVSALRAAGNDVYVADMNVGRRRGRGGRGLARPRRRRPHDLADPARRRAAVAAALAAHSETGRGRGHRRPASRRAGRGISGR